MKFLLDENFPASVAETVLKCGHQAIPFASTCSRGADDESVFLAAQSAGTVILTSDRDFYHTIPLSHPRHHGIIMVALRQPSRLRIAERLRWFLKNEGFSSLVNRVVVLRDFSYRIK